MGRAFNAKNLKSLTPWGFGYRSVMSGYTTVANSPLHFYEKVTKVGCAKGSFSLERSL